MCNPVVAYGLIAAATVMQGYSAYKQGQFERDTSRYNARQLENQAIRTLNKGTEEENKQRRFTAELMSQQTAQAAASGVDVGSGSALQIREDSALLGEVDALRIRQNFADQAQGLRDQADLTRAEGDNAAKRGRNQFVGSVIGAVGYGMMGMAKAVPPGGVDASWYSSQSAANNLSSNTGATTTLTGAQANMRVGSIA